MPTLAVSGEDLEGGVVSGDEICGILTVDCKCATVTRSISLTLSGREKTQTQETEFEGTSGAAGVMNLLKIASGGAPHIKSNTIVYRARHELIKMSVAVAGAAAGDAVGSPRLQLNPGDHQFPFKFRLPAALPGTFRAVSWSSSYTADIRYTLEARVDAPGWLDKTLKKPVRVLGNYGPASQLNKLIKPVKHSKSASKTFLGSEGRLSVDATLPTGTVLLGEKTTINLHVANDTKVKLTKIRLKLKTHATVTNGRSTGEASFDIIIPNDAETTHKSPRITTAHSTEVEFVPEGWIHRSLRVSLPVFVLAKGGGLREAKPTPIPSTSLPSLSNDMTANVASEDVKIALAEVGSWGGQSGAGSVTSTTTKGHPALHLACLRGQAGLARALIAAGCNPAQKTAAGFTALHSAAFGGDSATVLAISQIL